jgi:hypothetical protein
VNNRAESYYAHVLPPSADEAAGLVSGKLGYTIPTEVAVHTVDMTVCLSIGNLIGNHGWQPMVQIVAKLLRRIGGAGRDRTDA